MDNKTEKSKIGIPQIFKVSGVSFCKDIVNQLKVNDILTMQKDPENKYDKNAIKILNSENKMCGFVPKKYSVQDKEFILNELIIKKFDKITSKYKLVVHSLYKWDGPTGLEVKLITI